jgi:glycine reductase
MELRGKKAIVMGERDGVQGPAIESCLATVGTAIVYSVTECFA